LPVCVGWAVRRDERGPRLRYEPRQRGRVLGDVAQELARRVSAVSVGRQADVFGEGCAVLEAVQLLEYSNPLARICLNLQNADLLASAGLVATLHKAGRHSDLARG